MFKRILIANRGEIACRIIKTARKMGIETVAVYSDADKDALHVAMADTAIHIGPPEAAKSYLVIDKIVAACKSSGAEAVHPGYGFLSEREAFAEALQGGRHRLHRARTPRRSPPWATRSNSKKAAAAAKVSTVPGHLGVIADEKEAVKIANEIGYPVMIKASAGGGGKGMRIAYSESEVAEGFARSQARKRSPRSATTACSSRNSSPTRATSKSRCSATSTATSSISNERECSIQRRNQKVIEEAPSPLLDAATRKKMGEQAVALARRSATTAPAPSNSSPARTRASFSWK